MNFFPQLMTGATGQYPIVRRRRCRTARTVSQDAHTYKLADTRARRLEWKLRAVGLTDSEWGAIQALFESCEGRLKPFTFLDPAGNLLSHSEDLNANDWQRDSLVEVTTGIADPFGGTRAFRIVNTGQAAQGFTQQLDIPSDYHYCFSLYTRSGQQTTVTLLRYAGTAPAGDDRAAEANWTRLTSSGKLSATGVGMRFGLSLAPGATVEIFGLQVEAQPGASNYKATAAWGAVYPRARFDDDSLMLTTVAARQHATTIRIVSAPQDE